MGYNKVTKAQKKRVFEKSTGTTTLVDGPQNSHYLKKAKKGEEPVVFLSNNRTLIQRVIPTPLVCEFPVFSPVPSRSDDLDAYDFDDDNAFTTPSSPQKGGMESPSKKRHRATHTAQWESWQLQVIPALVPVFVQLWHRTRGLREADALPAPSKPACDCRSSILCKVSVVRFTAISGLEIHICECAPAAVQLLRAGFLAVDLRVLEFARNLFGRISPNNTAWTATMESFLRDLGFTLDREGALRRLFGSALEWYTHLRNQVNHDFDAHLERARLSYLEGQTDSTSTSTPQMRDTSTSPPTTPTSPSTPSTPRAQSASPTPAPRRAGKKRARESTPKVENPFKEPPPRTRPSEYLRRSDIPLRMDFNCCLDACFTQKRNAGPTTDPVKLHPDTHFLPEHLGSKMEEYVDSVRDAKPGGNAKKQRKATVEEIDDEADDHYEHADLKLPRSVLNTCEASFKAADETRQKASSQFYSDTGLMALLCRHDRVLWLVNMHSAGEKQFNVWLLLETLMQHLPLDIVVGILYDIACQAERSVRKWGFLGRYIDRLRFAVSVFHAFGHDWPCQVVYHPLKCEGFGFSNGEGCERFWHSISHLIAHLRISGYHHRLYTLDSQVKQGDEANLFKLAEWNQRRTLFSKKKRVEAEHQLKKSSHSKEFLKAQWKEQVKAQTKPAPRRSKTRGEKAVATVIELRNTTEAQKVELKDCEAALCAATDDGDDDALVDAKMARDDARAMLLKTQDRLRRNEAALGVDEKVQLQKHTKSKFFQLRFDARTKKIRLRNLLRARKFEWERAERSSRRQQASEHKLRSHTEAAVKRRQPKINNLVREYNKICDAIGVEIREHRAPARTIPPERIDMRTLYALDVDDAIWQDGVPPLWLSDDLVRSGIRAMLQIERADEEDAMLRKEARGLRIWFIEEWGVLNLAMENTANEPDRYQFYLRRERLVRLCATWRKHLPADTPQDAPWGPSEAELIQCMIDEHAAARGEDRYFEGDNESDREVEDFEMLDAMENAEAYRGTYDSSDEE
ncbi:hypothetical protein B0H14DRAFT_2874150 [Mycena olivaceomarginata]|nr:hypothetical protein B0H14DRAFT_2874150 [Mycena olivaceomarginata]